MSHSCTACQYRIVIVTEMSKVQVIQTDKTELDVGIKMIIFESLLITFEASLVFKAVVEFYSS